MPVRVRVRSPLKQYKKSASFIGAEEIHSDHFSNGLNDLGSNKSESCGSRVMVVIGKTTEAKGALEWALSHTVQSRDDTLILLHVANTGGKTNGEINQRAYDLLQATKNMCQMRRPEVHVEIAIKQGKEKAAIIVETAKQLKVSLLVLGHKKSSFLWQMFWTTRKRSWATKITDYCIQNADCMTVAVRRKNRKYGGYLITTKRHKNFWLLA